jgi:hypothetical protein
MNLIKVSNVLLILVILFGCKKQERQSTKSIKPLFTILSHNSLNPYDSIGHLHNYGLDYVTTSPYYPSSLTASRLWSIDSTMAKDSMGYTVNYPRTQITNPVDTITGNLSSQAQILALKTDTLLNRFKRYYMVNAYDSTYVNYLRAEFTLLNGGTINVATLASNLANEEVSINNDGNLTSDSKKSLLIMYAVTRNSAVYWNDASSDPSNLFNSNFTGNVLPGDRPVLIGILALVDGIGAGIGVYEGIKHHRSVDGVIEDGFIGGLVATCGLWLIIG